MRTCPTCSQVTDKYTEGLVQARLATRPFASPAQARYITKLEEELNRLTALAPTEMAEITKI